MNANVGIEGSSVIMLFGEGRRAPSARSTPRHFGPANDNGAAAIDGAALGCRRILTTRSARVA